MLVFKKREDNTFVNIKQASSMGIANCIQNSFGRFGFYLDRKSPYSSLRDFFLSLEPVDYPQGMQRVGSEKDGGYVLPQDLGKISQIISPGCDNKWTFEKEMFDRFGIPSVILDTEEKRPNDLYPEIHYIAKFIGNVDDDVTVSLDSLLRNNPDSGSSNLLQMDIEGAEYEVLRSASDETLSQFEIMIIEFHNLGKLRNYSHLEYYIKPLFARIQTSFDVINLNINNYGGVWKFNKQFYPRVIEVTFLRRGRINGYEKTKNDGITNLNVRNSRFFRHKKTEHFYAQLKY